MPGLGFMQNQEALASNANKLFYFRTAIAVKLMKAYFQSHSRQLLQTALNCFKRKEIQEKLIKFATRVPVFMYLTDYRERCLKDVITQLEPGLFKKVTALTIKDFELLVSLGVFNSALMNDAVYKFKRYEDASLNYTGISKHTDKDVGLYDTVITSKEFESPFISQPPDLN